MTGQEIITYCEDCTHCFESRRSPTGYACEVWGYEDFASPTILSGFCHKAKPKTYSQFSPSRMTLNQLRGIQGGNK